MIIHLLYNPIVLINLLDSYSFLWVSLQHSSDQILTQLWNFRPLLFVKIDNSIFNLVLEVNTLKWWIATQKDV